MKQLLPKSKADLEKLIADGIEESLQLEYKSSGALENTDAKKKEIAKDVSAMANSAGGVIIYGIKEFDELTRKHLPAEITPIDRNNFSKERLEQVINSSVSPKIEGLEIHPIHIDEKGTAYAVEIPQGKTAHQVVAQKDYRYYRRFNFQVEPMHDYEVRDIMSRQTHPVISLSFEIEKFTYEEKYAFVPNFTLPSPFGQAKEIPSKKNTATYTLKFRLINLGRIYAKYVNYNLEFPQNFVKASEKSWLKNQDNKYKYYGQNTLRDIVDVKNLGLKPSYRYGPSRFDPVLPGCQSKYEELFLDQDLVLDNRQITWTIYADNASPQYGSLRLNEIPVIVIKVEN